MELLDTFVDVLFFRTSR